MAASFWDPYSELDNLRRRLDRLSFGLDPEYASRRIEGALAGGEVAPASEGWRPGFDVRETDDAFVLHADFPGACVASLLSLLLDAVA